MIKRPRTPYPNGRIDHSVYGLGTIIEMDERHTTIAFDKAGTRKFRTSMVKLTASDTPLPARFRPKKKAKRSKRVAGDSGESSGA